MFTGIIETLGTLVQIDSEGSNQHFTFSSVIAKELKIDQSVSHNGCCLTVVECDGEKYRVTAVQETLQISNLGSLEVGDQINLERSLKVGDRLDGHFVQGHVDQLATCQSVEEVDGSWVFTFTHPAHETFRNVSKGSICVNGVSLTVVNPSAESFSVAIIPYTYEHTNFKNLHPGSTVNIEFDILGKYIAAQSR